MEVVRCPQHGTLCFLKTGVRDGPNKGKSFYVCPADTCNFLRATDIPVSHCLLHEGMVVELQGLFLPQGKKEYRLLFRCTRSKAEGKRWCGNIPWQDPNSKGYSVTSKSQHASEPLIILSASRETHSRYLTRIKNLPSGNSSSRVKMRKRQPIRSKRKRDIHSRIKTMCRSLNLSAGWRRISHLAWW